MGLIIGRESCECFLSHKERRNITGEDGFGEITHGWRCPSCGHLTAGEECQECEDGKSGDPPG